MDEVRINMSRGLLKRLEAAAAADDRTVEEALLVAVRAWVEAMEHRHGQHEEQVPNGSCGTGADGGAPERTRHVHDASEGGAEEVQK